jgi:hypothetical protein
LPGGGGFACEASSARVPDFNFAHGKASYQLDAAEVLFRGVGQGRLNCFLAFRNISRSPGTCTNEGGFPMATRRRMLVSEPFA